MNHQFNEAMELLDAMTMGEMLIMILLMISIVVVASILFRHTYDLFKPGPPDDDFTKAFKNRKQHKN